LNALAGQYRAAANMDLTNAGNLAQREEDRRRQEASWRDFSRSIEHMVAMIEARAGDPVERARLEEELRRLVAAAGEAARIAAQRPQGPGQPQGPEQAGIQGNARGAAYGTFSAAVAYGLPGASGSQSEARAERRNQNLIQAILGLGEIMRRLQGVRFA
jgi:hypothetical protein